jgi:MFS family permease
VLLPKLRGRIGTEGIMRSGMVATVAALLALALVRDQVLAAVAMAVMGMAWISILTTANVAAQTALPDWVRGRGLAIYLTVFYGAMTAGSLIWGAVADSSGVPVSLMLAAGVGLASLVLAFFKPLPEQELDLTPSMHWPEPAVSPGVLVEGEADRGPVLVTVEYLVAPEQASDFLAALREFKPERLRDGAFHWGIFEDTARPGRYVEHFLVASWLEHQRQHRRVSKADAELQAKAIRFHKGDGPPKVEHFIAPRITT